MYTNNQDVAMACCIYATAPFVTPDVLNHGLRRINEGDVAYVFSITSFPFPIHRALRITENRRIEMLHPEFMTTRSQDLEETYHDAGQFYWGRAEAWRSEKPLFSRDSAPVLLPRHMVHDIDTPEDWERAELIFRALELDKHYGE
jgi:N-acylneuraminate cytidylyltransferase